MNRTYGPAEIQVLTLPQCVRKRPGMYFARLENGKYITDLDNPKRLTKFIIEATCLSRAQAIAGDLTEIKIKVKDGNEVTISDNGPGICMDHTQIRYGSGKVVDSGHSFLETLLTELGACKNIKHEDIKSFCEDGIVMTNIVSKRFDVINKYKHLIYELNYIKGERHVPDFRASDVIGATEKESGLSINFVFDSELFGGLKIDKENLLEEIEKIRPTTPALITVEFE